MDSAFSYVRTLAIATLVCALLSFPVLADKLRITTVRLGHPMIARLTLEGYVAKEIQLTEGPMNGVSTLKGHNHGTYWLLKTDHFRVELQSAAQTFTGTVESVSGSTLASDPRPELSLEELASRTKSAAVFLKSLTKSGTGFFITATGVVVTNAHLARGEEALLATLPNGTQLEAKIVFVDSDLNIALGKTPGECLNISAA